MAGTNIVEMLKTDHQKVKSMFAQLDEIAEDKLGDYFCELRETLVRHEVAEEMTVYPVFRSEVPDGDQIADERIEEQSEAEEKLQQLEEMEPTSSSFRSELKTLRSAVLAHAEHEEETVLPGLSEHLPTARLEEMGERYEKAMKSAPTHPHPHAPDSPPGNMVMGPVAALADRMRDAMSKAS